jgi:small-conductance mechanosensitive channel
MIKKLFLLLSISIFLNATPNIEKKPVNIEKVSIVDLNSSKKDLDEELHDSIWITSYENYKMYQQLKDSENAIETKIARLERKSTLTDKQKDTLKELKKNKDEIDSKLKLLGEYTQDPFDKLVSTTKIGNAPKITNPFAIFSALSFLENIKSEQSDYNNKYKSLSVTVENLIQKEKLLQDMISSIVDNEVYIKELSDTKKLLLVLEPYLEVAKSTQLVYDKKLDEITISVNQGIKQESMKTMWVGMIIFILIGLLFVGKRLMRKYILDSKRFLKFNKILNVTSIIIVILVLLFAYIENASYLATVLGFASAGIAIAMKEWFMSIIGWFAIFFGGSIKVGDRIRVIKDGTEYVGDIINISTLKITLYEDVTLITYNINRRAGRIIFIPNNYIFTNMIASYNHEDLNTVWDGIDFTITFDSNINKASLITKEVVLKHSSQYVENTKIQLNKLRRRYNLRGMNSEPRVFTMIGEYGMKISVWYYTNSFATLSLRSQISAEIISRINNEDDITLAYPTQFITMRNNNKEVEI